MSIYQQNGGVTQEEGNVLTSLLFTTSSRTFVSCLAPGAPTAANSNMSAANARSTKITF